MKAFRNSMAQTIFLLIMGIILFSSVSGSFRILSTGDIGYSTGFQGPKAKFYGVRYNNQKFTSASQAQGASLARFDTVLNFDPDSADSLGKPNVIGEMTSIFVPEESLSNIIVWPGAKAIPQDWLKRAAVIPNPQETYSWNITGKTYKMEQWVLRFYLSFSGEWDGEEWRGSEVPYYSDLHPGQVVRNRFSNLEVWLEFDLTPTWYIQGGGTCYFAMSEIRVAEFKKTAHDIHGKEETLDTQMSVAPESPGALMYMYYGPWGLGSAERKASIYEGKQLNPALFSNKVYSHFDLNNFGITSWNNWGTANIKGDVATIGFDVVVFVIGEWDVKDIQNIPEDFGRTAKTWLPPSLADYLSDPRIQALIMLAVTAGIFILLLVAAPGVLFAIIALLQTRRRR